MSFSPFRPPRWLVALPLLGSALAAGAQSRLTAEDAVDLALSRPEVQQRFDAQLEIARSEVLAARTWPNPELSLEAERGTGDADARESSAVVSQTFTLGGRRGAQRAAAGLGVAAAGREVALERARLRAEVLRDYAAAAGAERRRDAHARAAGGLGELADIARRRAAAGDLSGYESRRIAQAREQAEARAADADAEARAARGRLAGRVGDVARVATLDTDLALPAVPVLPAAPTTAELDLLQARLAHAEAVARAERRPAVPLTVGVGGKRVEEAGRRESAMIVELEVPLPLFDRNQAARMRTAAEAGLAAAELDRARSLAGTRRAALVEQAGRLAESARRLLDGAVPEATRLTTIARASFAEGELDLVGLLDAYAAEAEVVDQALDQHARALDALLELQLLAPPSDPPTR